jgi:hypothetical protein
MQVATPIHRRPGVTVAQLQAKRLALLSELQSPEHVSSVVTREYGAHDPRIAPFTACACGAPARLVKLDDGKWSAGCSACNKRILDPQKYDWAACLQWCQLNLEHLNYQELPLFGLKGIDRKDAKVRLTSIYHDLLLKSQIATLDLSLKQRTHEHPAPGRDYIERLYAYRDWAKLALQLLKVESRVQPGGTDRPA